MTAGKAKSVRCAIYTRVSSDQGLEQDFNSLDAQYDASQAYIRSQVHAAWTVVRSKYDDGGFSGGNTDRPALQRLLDDVRTGKVDNIVVYKVDRNNHKVSRTSSEALLLGRIFDDRGHRMTPSHARKRGIKYRYYISSALLHGQTKRAGTVSRIPAVEIETLIAKSVRSHLSQTTEIEDAVLIRNHVARIEVKPGKLIIELANSKG